MTANGHVWNSSISLSKAPGEPDLRLHTVDFTFDQEAARRVAARYKKLRRHVPDACLAYTFTGLFETRADWSNAKMVYRDGTVKYRGFGHLGGSPAQLFIKSEDDVEQIPGCTAKGTTEHAAPAR